MTEAAAKETKVSAAHSDIRSKDHISNESTQENIHMHTTSVRKDTDMQTSRTVVPDTSAGEGSTCPATSTTGGPKPKAKDPGETGGNADSDSVCPREKVFSCTDSNQTNVRNNTPDSTLDADVEINPIYKLTLREEELDDTPSVSSSENGEEREVELICPRVNCPEKIIICIDISSEMERTSFKSRAGDKFTPMQLIRRALRFFLNTKSRLDRRHSYALVVLQESAIWMHDFTNDPQKMINLLTDLEGNQDCDTFDLASVFELIGEHVPFPVVENPAIIPPPYIVRVVLLYGRSHCIPIFSNREAQEKLRESPHFFLDVFYVHEHPSAENMCESIFDVMCELDEKGLSYVLEASRNPTKLYDCLSQLVAHPLQRPLQKDVSYSIQPGEPPFTAPQQSQYATL